MPHGMCNLTLVYIWFMLVFGQTTGGKPANFLITIAIIYFVEEPFI